MSERDVLAQEFEAHRTHLRAVAHRMLGSVAEADDAVQEAWLRLDRAGGDGVDNLRAWLTTVVSRVCLDQLRTRAARREEPVEPHAEAPAAALSPEEQAVLADSVGAGLLVVLDALSPGERIAFVLHDLFGVPFDEIAPVVGRSTAATKMLASRARRRVRGADEPHRDRDRERRVVAAFLDASRSGDFARLLALLDPDVTVRADATVVSFGSAPEVRGATAVVETFSGRARAARLALINGVPGAVWLQGGEPRVVLAFTVVGERIVGIDLVADPDRLAALDLEVIDR